jgi:hypothetical protein
VYDPSDGAVTAGAKNGQDLGGGQERDSAGDRHKPNPGAAQVSLIVQPAEEQKRRQD